MKDIEEENEFPFDPDDNARLLDVSLFQSLIDQENTKQAVNNTKKQKEQKKVLQFSPKVGTFICIKT